MENVELKHKLESKAAEEKILRVELHKDDAVPAKPFVKMPAKWEFTFGGEVQAGGRNIEADRSTGNEQSAYYKADLHGNLAFDNETGIYARTVFKTPVSKRARYYKLYSELNDNFDLRELFIYLKTEEYGNFKFGKFKFPFGVDNPCEDDEWNEPLLENYINRTGNYDIGVRWEKKFLEDALRASISLTGGNAGNMDTNSAPCLAGDINYTLGKTSIGCWGKRNQLDTTPIKRDDNAVGFYAQMKSGGWKLMGKYGWLNQGLRKVNFTPAELVQYGFDTDESTILLWEAQNGGENRSLTGWYIYGEVPVSERLGVLGHYGQLHDAKDPFEKTRDRFGIGAKWSIKDVEDYKIFISGGIAVDSDKSNTRMYIKRGAVNDDRNGRQTLWINITCQF